MGSGSSVAAMMVSIFNFLEDLCVAYLFIWKISYLCGAYLITYFCVAFKNYIKSLTLS